MALQGPYFAMVGLSETSFSFLNLDRQRYFSLALNGYFFLALMLITDHSKSLDLRRASRILEPLALLHMLGPLYLNARAQRGNPLIGFDVSLYLGTVGLLFWIGPWKSLWRVLVGALGGVALGSYLLIDLELVRKSVFALSIGLIGLVGSTVTYLYLLRSEKLLIKKRTAKKFLNKS
ncbi:MAG: hypothetical protein JWM99_4321 [Verrucomicrobiales bacterium]|nr:hypothetical protein [Verrucomicrobiales bacterium]